jgi:hypothetical protein
MPYLFWIVLPLALMDTFAFPQHAEKKQEDKQDE